LDRSPSLPRTNRSLSALGLMMPFQISPSPEAERALMHLLTTFTSLRGLEQTSMLAASSISTQVPHTRLSRLQRNHHSASHNPNSSPAAVVALRRASMQPPSRAMQALRSRVLKSRSSVTGGLEWVRALYEPRNQGSFHSSFQN